MLQVVKQILIQFRNHSGGQSFVPSSSCSSYSVSIISNILRSVEINHMLDAMHIDPSSRQISAHQHLHLSILEVT